MTGTGRLCVAIGPELAAYSLGETHPFGPARHDRFVERFRELGLDREVQILVPSQATQEDIELFHTHEHVERVKALSVTGEGFLDQGDTPAFVGMYEAAATVVGTVLYAADRIMAGDCVRGFVPIAGLHHARREAAAGFCVFNDCGVLIEALHQRHDLKRIAYVDIDAHHGDGVFYGFESDPGVTIVDVHEDGRFLYPGTGFASETGKGEAAGTKLNLPMPMGATDEDFLAVWGGAQEFIAAAMPEFVILQCGADSLEGDPITHLRYSKQVHATVARDLRLLAEQSGHGRILALGGGGYNLENLAHGWCAVVDALS